MKKFMLCLLSLVMLFTQISFQIPANAQDDDARVPYQEFLDRFHSFLAAMHSDQYQKSSVFQSVVKKEGKDGRMPFTFTGPEGKLNGYLAGDRDDGSFSGKESGLVDSFTLSLKYPGDIHPVLAGISALSAHSSTNLFNKDLMTNTAYRQVNPNDEGQFDIRNYRVSTLKKTKQGLASEIGFMYTAGARPDASVNLNLTGNDITLATQDTVPIDVKGFFERYNFIGRTVASNLLWDKFTEYKVKTGKENKEGLVPFSSQFKGKFVTNTFKGLARNGIVETVTFRHENKVPIRIVTVFELLYAISGLTNTSGLLSYKDLEQIANPFGGKYFQTEWTVLNGELVRSEISSKNLKMLLQANPINGYKVEYDESDDGSIIEYRFTLLPESTTAE